MRKFIAVLCLLLMVSVSFAHHGEGGGWTWPGYPNVSYLRQHMLKHGFSRNWVYSASDADIVRWHNRTHNMTKSNWPSRSDASNVIRLYQQPRRTQSFAPPTRYYTPPRPVYQYRPRPPVYRSPPVVAEYYWSPEYRAWIRIR